MVKAIFICKDNGKMAMTLFSRKTGKGVRIIMKSGVFLPDETHMALMRKAMSGKAAPDETDRFHELHLKRSCDVLEMSEDDLFTIQNVTMELPATARIEPSEPCSRCNERPCERSLKKKTARRFAVIVSGEKSFNRPIV